MPEGDTIWRSARTLHAALAGRILTGFASSLPTVAAAARRLRIVGQSVASVEPRGKHLLVRFSGGPVLYTHMRMNGSWFVYRAGTPWCRSARARVAIEAGDVQAVCFAAPVVEMLSAGEVVRHPALTRLGEDLLGPNFEPERARLRLRALGEEPIGSALLDQTAVAGIGNVYKSEVLFLCGVSPFARVDGLDDAELDRVIATARVQMQRNLGSGLRRTTPALAPERHWVYGRRGRPCRRCGFTIAMRRQGEEARSSYFCPRCQGGREEPAALKTSARPPSRGR